MIIDAIDRVIQIKIVYFGPAMSGKTTSLKSLFSHFGKDEEIESIESTVKRTLFFDYGTIKFRSDLWLLKIHIYSTTGQDFYIVTRPITLKAIDGIIFVADSERTAFERNLISWNELSSYFKDALQKLPKVIAFNKQDKLNKFNPQDFLNQIAYNRYENIEKEFTIALNGEGILSSFENLLRLVFKEIYEENIANAVH